MATVIEELRLINVAAEANMNRWWTGRVYDNGDFEALWGRVGKAAQTKLFPGGGKPKLEEMRKEKSKKGYTELKTVGGPATSNVSQVKDVGRHELREIARSQLLKTNNPNLDRLIDRLVQANVHRITSSTQITFNSSTGLFSTPLGIVTPEGIAQARSLLVILNQCVTRNDYVSSTMSGAVNQYLRIVPQDLGMKRFDARSLFPDNQAIQKQLDVLDSLESSYQALQGQKPSTTPSNGNSMEQVFRVDLDVLSKSNPDWARLERWYEGSKKDMHNYRDVKIRQIYTVNLHEMTNAYEGQLVPHQEVFHGTSQANCLSILKSGLKCAPPTTAAIAGKLFGNGVYGAVSSSKSLGYTFNRWGQGGVGDAGWLFICQFAMGKIQNPDSATEKGPPAGYDSIWAKGGKVRYQGRTLFNDELIVYRNSQVRITHLLECKD
jgi:poly [ADP-ribose] polymerase